MPGWPTRMATRALRDVVAASTAARSRSRSASRLTNGAAPSGRGAGAASGASDQPVGLPVAALERGVARLGAGERRRLRVDEHAARAGVAGELARAGDDPAAHRLARADDRLARGDADAGEAHDRVR